MHHVLIVIMSALWVFFIAKTYRRHVLNKQATRRALLRIKARNTVSADRMRNS